MVFDGDFLRFSRRNHPKPGAPQASSTSIRTVSSASPILASSGSRLSISARQRKFHEVRRDSEGQMSRSSFLAGTLFLAMPAVSLADPGFTEPGS